MLSAVIILEICFQGQKSFLGPADLPERPDNEAGFELRVKNVDLGGINNPSRAVRWISATLTGRMSTAAAALPLVTSANVSSRPCW